MLLGFFCKCWVVPRFDIHFCPKIIILCCVIPQNFLSLKAENQDLTRFDNQVIRVLKGRKDVKRAISIPA